MVGLVAAEAMIEIEPAPGQLTPEGSAQRAPRGVDAIHIDHVHMLRHIALSGQGQHQSNEGMFQLFIAENSLERFPNAEVQSTPGRVGPTQDDRGGVGLASVPADETVAVVSHEEAKLFGGWLTIDDNRRRESAGE